MESKFKLTSERKNSSKNRISINALENKDSNIKKKNLDGAKSNLKNTT
jgi:5-bromo-4-chloroindolyl phosphate hydrolysis protein